jgi:acetylcholinesterase
VPRVVVTYPTNSVGDLRFRRPQALGPYTGTYNASAFGHPCPQQKGASAAFPSGFPNATIEFLENPSAISQIPDSEDCV